MPELIDLSQEIYHKRPSRPSQPSCAIWDSTTHEESKNQYKHGGISFRIKGLIICDHEATHTDAFTHIDPRPGAESIDQMPLTMF